MTKKMELFEAAQRIINSKGVSHLTLDNIAKEAGISKGGLLHYFPNKNALIREAIQAVLDNYSDEMNKISSEDPNTGHFLRSYAEVSLNNPQQLTAGLIAATATDLELLKPIQDHYEKWQRQIEEDGLDPVLATMIRLTIDGLWFCDLFGLAPPKEELREDLLTRLVSLTQEKNNHSDD